MSKVRLCVEILPTGLQCKQIALKNKPWCHSHAGPAERERNADHRQLVASIAKMDLFTVALTFGTIVQEFRDRHIPPLHAQALADAVSARLDELVGDLARQSRPVAAVTPSNSHEDKRLHVVPMK